MQDRVQLMPMAQAMKGMTLLAATRSAGNPANTVRPSDAWWAPLGRDLVPLRQIVVEHPPNAVRDGAIEMDSREAVSRFLLPMADFSERF